MYCDVLMKLWRFFSPVLSALAFVKERIFDMLEKHLYTYLILAQLCNLCLWADVGNSYFPLPLPISWYIVIEVLKYLAYLVMIKELKMPPLKR
jgi:hypothetical protein